MSAEDIAICSMCDITFNSHDEVIGHTCIEIKEEKLEMEDIKDACDLSENDSEYCPKRKKSTRNTTTKSKIKEGQSKRKFKIDAKKRKRNPKNVSEAFKCSKCVLSFSQKGSLNRHVATIHDGKKKNDVPKHHDLDTNDQTEGKLELETNELQVNEQKDEIVSSNIELSEQFIVLILKQVDKLCENIKYGDPDLERRMEVNENLNNAVSCYRNKIFLIESKLDRNEVVIERENERHFLEDDVPHSENESSFENKKNEYNSQKVTKGKKKKKMSNENIIKIISTDGDISKKLKSSNISVKRAPIWNYFKLLESDLSKATCDSCGGKFSLCSDKPKFQNTNSLKGHLKSKHQNEFSKYLEELNGVLLKQELSGKQLEMSKLFSSIKFDHIEDKFQCLICNKTTAGTATGRKNLFRHVKLMHKKELESNDTDQFAPTKTIGDCGNSMCKQIYGSYERFWCENCIFISKVKQPRKKYKNKVLKDKLCPECGKSVAQLLNHMNSVHSNQKLLCPHCDRICKSKMILNHHIKKVHEKLPCIHCGKLISLLNMTKHIQVQHTPDSEKKYQCDDCGKGFFETGLLKDHINIHTGEKPYKCKFCSSCFASRGTWAMHEKGHLGHKRKSIKK